MPMLVLQKKTGTGDIPNVSDFTYASKAFDYSTPPTPDETTGQGINIKPDGTRFLIMGRSSGSRYYQHTMSTPWDISTGSYDSVTLEPTGPGESDGGAMGFEVKPDGTKMYMAGFVFDQIYQFTLTTPWALTAYSFDGSVSISGQSATVGGMDFSSDGTKVYILDTVSKNAYQYSLTVAWDITSGFTYDSVSFSAATETTNPEGIEFNPDGSQVWISSFDGNIYQYDCPTAWDLTGATYSGNSLDIATPTGGVPSGVFFKDANTFYVIERGTTPHQVHQFEA